jgi:hypothetical protein
MGWPPDLTYMTGFILNSGSDVVGELEIESTCDRGMKRLIT